jgi:integrase
LAFDAHSLMLRKHLDRWLSDSVGDTVRPGSFVRYEQITRLHVTPALGGLRLKNVTPPASAASTGRSSTLGSAGARCSTSTPRCTRPSSRPPRTACAAQRGGGRQGAAAPEGGDMSPHRRTGACPAGRGARRPLRSPVRPRRALRAQAGELLGLKWEDVDLPSGVLRVRRTLSVAKDGPIFNPPKTAKDRRAHGRGRERARGSPAAPALAGGGAGRRRLSCPPITSAVDLAANRALKA